MWGGDWEEMGVWSGCKVNLKRRESPWIALQVGANREAASSAWSWSDHSSWQAGLSVKQGCSGQQSHCFPLTSKLRFGVWFSSVVRLVSEYQLCSTGRPTVISHPCWLQVYRNPPASGSQVFNCLVFLPLHMCDYTYLYMSVRMNEGNFLTRSPPYFPR